MLLTYFSNSIAVINVNFLLRLKKVYEMTFSRQKSFQLSGKNILFSFKQREKGLENKNSVETQGQLKYNTDVNASIWVSNTNSF